jgi:hypothetical protein
VGAGGTPGTPAFGVGGAGAPGKILVSWS